MAINYTNPLSLPTHTGIASIELHAINAVAYSQSPFTFQGQAHAYSGEMWTADVSLPPMKRSDAERWIAFLMSLRGQYHTFLLGDPNGTSVIDDASSLIITGTTGERVVDANIPVGETIKAGDYFSLGTGNDQRLYKVLSDYTGTGSLQSNVLDIWPALRADASAESADLTTPQGRFRLASSDTNWSINDASFYGLTFGAIEAL